MLALALAGATASAKAQGPAVVQLPSYSWHSVNTSVSAPDRGSISLGGIGRSSMGSTAFGPGLGPGNRSFGRSMSGSSTSMHATIHDMDALDRATLERSSAGRRAADQANADRWRRLSAARHSSAGQVPAGSVAEARRKWAADAASDPAEAVQDVKRARAAAEAGKSRVAAMFYQLAAKRAAGDLKSQINKEAASFARDVAAGRIAQNGRQPAMRPSKTQRAGTQ